MKLLRPELFLDTAWLVFSIAYVVSASHYPPAARLVPMTVGLAASAIGAIHFSGNFIRALRPYTHGTAEAERPTSVESDDNTFVDDNEGTPASAAKRPSRSLLAATAWAAGLVLGMKLIGVVWAVLVFFVMYFGVRGRRWGWGVIFGILMALLTWGFFQNLLSAQLPSGVITTRLISLF